MTTVTEIAGRAFDRVSARITDAVHSASIVRTTNGAYNASTGAYATTTATTTGRAVFANETPIEDIFPDYVVGASDQMLILEGFASVKENDDITIGGVTRTVRRVQDIAGAGSVFYVVAR